MGRVFFFFFRRRLKIDRASSAFAAGAPRDARRHAAGDADAPPSRPPDMCAAGTSAYCQQDETCPTGGIDERKEEDEACLAWETEKECTLHK